MTGGRLPNGKMTTSTRRYIDEWRKIGRQIEKMIKPAGYRLGGFDPGFLFYHERSSWDIPTEIALAIIAHCAKEKHGRA